MRLIPTFLGLASVATLASSAGVESQTTCHTSYGSVRTTEWHTFKTTSACHPVSTSTITETRNWGQPEATSTIRKTKTTTEPTKARHTTVTTSVTATKIITSYSNIGASPTASDVPSAKRDVYRRKAAPLQQQSEPEVYCTVWQWPCSPWVSTTTATSWVGSTKTVTSTITPIITSIKTRTTTVSTTTSTVTSTYASFYIVASSDTAVPDGTTLTNQPDGNDGEGNSTFTGGNTIFALDPATGQLYDTANDEIANVTPDKGVYNVFFDTMNQINDYGYIPCDCAINGYTLALSCNCDGDTVFQTSTGGFLFIGKHLNRKYYTRVKPLVEPIFS